MNSSKRLKRARDKAAKLNRERQARGRASGKLKRLAKNPTPEFLAQTEKEKRESRENYDKRMFSVHLRRLSRFQLPVDHIQRIMSQPAIVRQKVIVRMNQTVMHNKYFGGAYCTRKQENERRLLQRARREQ